MRFPRYALSLKSSKMLRFLSAPPSLNKKKASAPQVDSVHSSSCRSLKVKGDGLVVEGLSWKLDPANPLTNSIRVRNCHSFERKRGKRESVGARRDNEESTE